MIKKISLYSKIIILLVCYSCDGIDCIHPADFGNMGYYNLKLNSNPFEGDSFKSVTISSSVDISASYVGLSKDCGANIIEANTGVYHWLDTGINIVDLDRKISLKIAGAANFCAPIFGVEKDEDGEISSVQNVASCTQSVTKFHTGYLTEDQSMASGVKNDVAKEWQPYFTSGSKDSYACSESASSEKSAYYLSGVDSFYVSIPRPLTGDALTQAASQAYTVAQAIATEAGETLNYSEAELQLGLGKLNSHSESGEHTDKVLDGYGPYILNSSCDADNFALSKKYYLDRYEEDNDIRVWHDGGKNIRVGLFADLDSSAASISWNLDQARTDPNVGSGIAQEIADLTLAYNNKKINFATEETERLEVKYDILADKELMEIKQEEINNFITNLDIEALGEEIMANITLDLEDEVIISNIQAEFDYILEYYIRHMLDIYAGKSFDLVGYFNSIVVGSTTNLSYLQQAKNNLTNSLGYEEGSSALTYLENIYKSYLSNIGSKAATSISISAWYDNLQPELESLEKKLNSDYSEVYAEIGVSAANKNIYEEMTNLLSVDQLDGKTVNQISFEYTINSLVESVFKLFLGEQASFNYNAIELLYNDKNIEDALYAEDNINNYLEQIDIETLSENIYNTLNEYYDNIKDVVDGRFITETANYELDEAQELSSNIAIANEYYQDLIEAESAELQDTDVTSTEGFIKNPYPPGDLIVNENQCANDADRYFYTIDYAASGAAGEGVNENMYNYCDKDVFLYNSSTALSGYIKFKLSESDGIMSEFSCCAGDYYNTKGPHCNCRVTGSKGGKWSYWNPSQGYCGSPSESDGVAWRAGCWKKYENCHIPSEKTAGSVCSKSGQKSCSILNIPGIKYYGYKYKPDSLIYYDNLMDNFGEYDIEVGTPTSCLKSFPNVEFRIGEDIAANRRILDSANYIGVPWNTGRLFVRVVDDSILQQDNRECAWFEDDNLVIAAGATVDSSLKDLYKNNAGTYKITILAAKEVKAITQLKNILQSKFEDTGIFADEYRESFYESLIAAGSTFQSLLLIAMTLYIALTAATFLLGLTQITQTDLLFRVLKIGLIYTLLTPGSWEYFSYFIKIFEEGSVELSSIIAGSFLDIDSSDTTLGLEPKDIIYGLIDEIVDLFFQPPIHFKISAVFFSPIFIGVILFLLIYYALFLVLYAIGKSIILYFIIKLVFVMLFMVGPIFIVFSLFERTKGMFDNWLNMVISYSIQLLFLFITIAFFSYLIVDIFYQMFFYGVCWKPVWIIKIGILPEFEFFSFWRLHGFDPRYSASYNVSRGPDLTTVLFFLVIAYAFKELVEKVTALGNKLSGGGGVAAGDLGQQMMKDTFGAIGDLGKSLRKRLISPVLGGAAYSAFQITKGMARVGDITSTRATNLGLSATSSVPSNTSIKNMSLLRAYDKLSGVPNFLEESYKKSGPLNLIKDKLGTRTVPSGRGKSYDDKVRGYVSKEIKEAREFTKNRAMSNKEAQKAIRKRVKKKLENYEMSDSKRKAIHASLDRDDFTHMLSKVSLTASASTALNNKYGAGMSVKTALAQNKISYDNLVARQKLNKRNIEKLESIKDKPGEKARIRHLIEEISSDKAYMEEELKGFDDRREAILSSQRDRLEDTALRYDEKKKKEVESELDKLKSARDIEVNIIRQKELALESLIKEDFAMLAELKDDEQKKKEVKSELDKLKSAGDIEVKKNQAIIDEKELALKSLIKEDLARLEKLKDDEQKKKELESELDKLKARDIEFKNNQVIIDQKELALAALKDGEQREKEVIGKLGLYRYEDTEDHVKVLLQKNEALITAASETLRKDANEALIKDAEGRLDELEEQLKNKREVIDRKREALQPKIKGFQEKNSYEQSILQVDIDSIANLEKALTEKTLEQEKLANYLYQEKGEKLKTAPESLGTQDKEKLKKERESYKEQLADAKKFEIEQLKLKLDTIDTNTIAGKAEEQRLTQEINSLESQVQSLTRS